MPARSLTLAVLVALGIACGPQGPGGEPSASGPVPGEGTSASAPGGAAPAPSRDRNLVSLDEAEAMQVYYQFVDERGRVRFVSTLAEVPAEWRARVGFVEMSSPPPNSPADAQRLRDKHTARVVLPARRGGSSEDSGGRNTEVIMYSADWCGVCTRAKRYMNDRGIEYDERNVDEEQWAKEMRSKAGQGGIPVFDVGGKILRGFSPERLDELVAHAS